MPTPADARIYGCSLHSARRWTLASLRRFHAVPPYLSRVVGSSQDSFAWSQEMWYNCIAERGYSSVVERHLPKVNVRGSNPLTRSLFLPFDPPFTAIFGTSSPCDGPTRHHHRICSRPVRRCSRRSNGKRNRTTSTFRNEAGTTTCVRVVPQATGLPSASRSSIWIR